MSWPQWAAAAPAQPAVPPVLNPTINPAPAVVPPGLQYTPEQWAQMQQQNWNQWAQWQQQYQQWHQQYGAEYQKSMNALAQAAPPQPGLPNVAVPPPLPVEVKPPPPTEDPPPPPYAAYNSQAPPPQTQGYSSVAKAGEQRPPVHYNRSQNQNWPNQNQNFRNQNQNQNQNQNAKFPNPNQNQNYRYGEQNKRPFEQADQRNAKRPMLSRPAWQPNQTPPPVKPRENSEELSEAEKKFDKQFAEWEAQFNKWKEQNVEHPDKQQYREYEKKWETWRAQLLDRREQMRRKRLGLPMEPPKRAPLKPQQNQTQPGPNAPPKSATPVALEPSFTKPPPNLNDEPLQFRGKPPSENVEEDVVDDFIKPNVGGGIPGLDLVEKDPKSLPKDNDDVVVIDPEEKEETRKGPDFDAISKGINTILGDEKLMNILSMVSQTQNSKNSDNLTTTVSQIKDGEYPEQSNQSFEEQSNHSGAFPQREFVNNFDDQTRSSFTMTHNDDMRFDGPGNFNKNKGNFRGNRFENEEYGRNEFNRPPPHDNFGFNPDRSAPERFNPNEDRFPPNQERFPPNQERFPPNQERFPPNQERFPPKTDRFGANDRFNSNQDRFGANKDRFPSNQDRPGPGGDRFGPNQGRFGPNQDRFGANQDRPRDEDRAVYNRDRQGFGGERLRFAPNEDMSGFGGDRQRWGFGAQEDRPAPANDRFPPNQHRPVPENRFADRGGDRFGHDEDRDHFDGQDRFDRFDDGPNRLGLNQNNFGANRFNSNDDTNHFGQQDRFDPQDEYFEEEEFHGNYDENYDEYDYDAEAARFEQNEEKPFYEKEEYDEDKREPTPEPPKEEEIFQPATLIDYEHKSLKSVEPEVLIEPIFMFDYRHKPLSRIPYPQRPKWLSDLCRGIREFAPPLTRQLRPYPKQDDHYHYQENLSHRRYEDPYEDRSNSRQFEDRWEEKRPYSEDRRSFPEERRPYSEDRKDRRSYTEDRRTYEEKKSYSDQRKFVTSMDYEEEKISDTEWPEDEEMTVKEVVKVVPKFQKPEESKPYKAGVTLIEDLITAPGRYKRPPRLVIILRGPPGSGKTFLAKLIKDKEVENGGSAPRILSLDDYFMIEQEKEAVEDGKRVKVKEMVYEYEAEMEDSYRISLIKSFKKTITDGYFSFIVVDNVNDKVKYFGEMWSFAKQNGFQVYICQLDLDVQICSKRNIHGRSQSDIEKCVANWEATPSHHPILDATSLLQSASILEVEMEEVNSPEADHTEHGGMERSSMESVSPSGTGPWKSTSNWTPIGRPPNPPGQARRGFAGPTWRSRSSSRR